MTEKRQSPCPGTLLRPQKHWRTLGRLNPPEFSLVNKKEMEKDREARAVGVEQETEQEREREQQEEKQGGRDKGLQPPDLGSVI